MKKPRPRDVSNVANTRAAGTGFIIVRDANSTDGKTTQEPGIATIRTCPTGGVSALPTHTKYLLLLPSAAPEEPPGLVWSVSVVADAGVGVCGFIKLQMSGDTWGIGYLLLLGGCWVNPSTCRSRSQAYG